MSAPPPPPTPEQRCAAVKTDGTVCLKWPIYGSEFCLNHDPDRVNSERRCTATATGGTTRPARKGERCDAFAMHDQNVCAAHGGRAPQNLSEAKRRGGQRRAAELMLAYGRKIETTPTDALLEEVQWTAGHVAWLRERVGELEQNEMVWNKTRAKEGGHDSGITEEAAPHMWLKLYQQERAHLVKVCGEAIRCGIEERRVRLAESQGVLVAQMIRAILGDLDLSPEQAARVPEVVPRHLRALSNAS